MNPLYRASAIPILAFALLFSLSPSLLGKERKRTKDKQLATIDGIGVTESQARTEGAADLNSLELKMLREKAEYAQNEHAILEDATERLVEEKLLELEAVKRGISKEELITMEVLQKVKEPTAEEIDAFYEMNKERIKKPKEAVATQIVDYLKRQREKSARQDFVEKLEKEHQVVRLLEPLRFDVNAPGCPSQGPASAPAVLVLFSDFQCPYCKAYSATIKEVIRKYGNKVRVVFRQFPLSSIHPDAERAAEASLCAAAQNRFWEMHDLIFQNQKNLKEADLKDAAGKLGLDVSAFATCLSSARFAPTVREDMRAASAAGVDGTPALFINGRFLYGVRPYEEIAAVIDEELKAKK